MKAKKQKKSGFTLVELMVVAIIVAILAAVAIPLMSGNTDAAMATEGQTGCATVATGIKLWLVEGGDTNSTPAIAELPGISVDNLKGNYFDTYEINSVGGPNTYTITATGRGKAAGKELTMTVADGVVTWSGLVDTDDEE
ncbi:prepilin-type N-terminal cleavage/methylation domain-containing protein [Pontiellaceae bacterium B12219]|nr:prepilin-type N-terminal cleavage/methylation domain-containing protein [Pontiellaceae bacterium B12219]